jgi:hypothetical protein
MTRHFNPLVERKCTKCGEVRPPSRYTYCKRKNVNEIVYYQRADCNICRAESEQQRRNKSKQQ